MATCHPDKPMRGHGLCSTCYKRDYWQKNKAKFRSLARDRHLRNTYGLSAQKYEAMLEAQGRRCAACRDVLPSNAPRAQVPHVDHCHRTGKVRGILCPRCNSTLGMMKDSRRRALALAEYLHKHGGADDV